MMNKQEFCKCELHCFSNDDAEAFFDWLKKNHALTYSRYSGWRWDYDSALCPSSPADVLDLFYYDFKPAQSETK